ncbi:DUF397 domain-containing protein [Sphaerisporangium rubeum]|uniref:DUF397 domain-containing protein n=1 Tax=Sphaerisporangium rubeum TaxID=321317 RepID=A0A7X0IHE5_9ACTN|nr:DUF397 domain-containing protein [Sphaerisporangium rubeum]MBB6475015.1 hypothetical protein [Sphaerisporangium rubeum]
MDKLTTAFDTSRWKKSTYSGSNGGNCVEVANLSGGRRAVRDSKDRCGPALVVPAREWTVLVRLIKGYEVG